jgi:pimeloyl-ACP methyl ester carboxylesterase
MYYEVHGQGAPLVMLHGGTGSLDTWGPLVADLAKKYQVITPEQMGHGRTGDDPKRAFHFHDMAEDTAELLRQLKVGPAFVFGWSDGGIVALDLAMSHPELVKKLAVSGANFRNDAGAYGDDGVKFMQTIKPEQWPKSLRKSYERRSPDGAKHWPVLFERLRKMWLTEPAYTPEQLGTIKAPTLVVAGDQDVILAEHTVLLFDAIPGAELWLVPNSDHFVPISHAPAFEAQLDAFFQEQPGKKDQ